MTLKELITQLIGTNTTYIDQTSGTLVPDYAFIVGGVLLIVFVFIFIKGIFALCKK